MVIFKITLQILGDRFFPKGITDQIKSAYLLADINNPGEKIRRRKEKVYESGSLDILHPRTYGLQYDNWAYEEWYIDFIEMHHAFFTKHGADDFRLFIEVYYSGDQCNFEIINKDLLRKIKEIDISIPISVYRLTEDQIIDMLKETGFSEEEISNNE